MHACLAFLLALVPLACRVPASEAAPGPSVRPALFEGVSTFEIESRVLGETRRLCAYTPPGYAESGELYPVLYLPDGGLEEDFVHVVEAVHFGVQWGLLRPLLVVGIENTERRRDLTGPTDVESDRAIAPHVGASAAFRDFLRDELMPEVARRYRVSGNRAIMGESLAGLFVVETFLVEPELFDTWVAFSPSLWWNDHALVRHAAELLEARPADAARLYLTSANETDIVSWIEELTRALAHGAPTEVQWSYLRRPDEFHDTIYRASAPRALRVLYGLPQPGD